MGKSCRTCGGRAQWAASIQAAGRRALEFHAPWRWAVVACSVPDVALLPPTAGAGNWRINYWGKSECVLYEGTVAADYSCACEVPTSPLAWRPLAACLAGVSSATGGDWPPVCRMRRSDDLSQPFDTGHVIPRNRMTGDWGCKASNVGGDGYLDGIGFGPQEFQVLCRGADAAGCSTGALDQQAGQQATRCRRGGGTGEAPAGTK